SLILRATATAPYPSQRSRRTIPRPRPRLPPVTRTLRTAGQLAGTGNVQRGDEPQNPRDLVRREVLAAERQNLPVEIRQGIVVRVRTGLVLQHDVRGDERTGDPALLRSHHRHADRRMSVDRRL